MHRRALAVLAGSFLLSCSMTQPQSQPPKPKEKPPVAKATKPVPKRNPGTGAKAVCPNGRVDELGAAVGGVFDCSVTPPWTEFTPFVRCPESGCWKPCRSIEVAPDEIVTRYRYDPQGRVVEAVTKTPNKVKDRVAKWQYTPTQTTMTDTLLGTYTYRFDAKGDLTNRETDTFKWTYERDAGGKVTLEKGERKDRPDSAWLYEYRYDDKGRLVSRKSISPIDQMELEYTYRDDGFQDIAKIRGRLWRLHWDKDRIIGAKYQDASAPDTVKVFYDTQGRLTSIEREGLSTMRFEYECKD